MKSRNNFLVIGGESQLGVAILKQLIYLGENAIITTRKKGNQSDSVIYLDLQDISSWKAPEGIKTAFFCAGATSIEVCRVHPQESRTINVDNTLRVATGLLKKDASIIFPSTNLVFDGKAPNPTIGDATCPGTEYGRQKAEIEERLLASGGNVSVLRFTKIIGLRMPLILQWLRDLMAGKSIHAFSDMVLAPISLDFASKVLLSVALGGGLGVWHVSAKKDVTYEEIARYLAKQLGASSSCVQPIRSADSGLTLETVPLYSALDTSRVELELGFGAPDPYKAIDWFLRKQG